MIIYLMCVSDEGRRQIISQVAVSC